MQRQRRNDDSRPGVQIRITDPQSHAEVRVGEQGRLWVRGANLMLGYLNLPEKTAVVIHTPLLDTSATEIARQLFETKNPGNLDFQAG